MNTLEAQIVLYYRISLIIKKKKTFVTPYPGVSKWAGTFTRLRSCIVPAEITEPPKISGGQNHKYDGRQACGIFFIKN